MSATNNHNGTLELEPEPVERVRTAVLPTPSRPLPQPAKTGSGRKLLIAILAALLIVGCILWQRSRTFGHLATATAEMAVPIVSTTLPTPGPAQTEIQLPGNLMAFSEASIYARTNGYLKAWYTDIGAKLTAGELMAVIEAPDVDAQLRQAQANLSQARANLDIAQIDFGRARELLATIVISKQEFDNAQTTLEARQAALQSAASYVQDLTVEQGFEKITAPFPGIVTKRDTDVGALINAGSNANSANAQELFHIDRTDILRLYISVPEVYSPLVRLDTPVWLELAEYPGVKFQGKVADVAGAIDLTSRTLQTEVEVPNPDGRLFPGAYAIVHLVLKLHDAPSVVPVNTLIFRTQGTQVGVVDASNIVHLKDVVVGRDFGTTLEITSGIEPTDRLILNPSDSLADGSKVQVQNSPAAAH